MSVRALIGDIMTAANDDSARDRQYRDSVFDLTFNKITTIDTMSIEANVDGIAFVANGNI